LTITAAVIAAIAAHTSYYNGCSAAILAAIAAYSSCCSSLKQLKAATTAYDTYCEVKQMVRFRTKWAFYWACFRIAPVVAAIIATIVACSNIIAAANKLTIDARVFYTLACWRILYTRLRI
jgi:hypothetical protein